MEITRTRQRTASRPRERGRRRNTFGEEDAGKKEPKRREKRQQLRRSEEDDGEKVPRRRRRFTMENSAEETGENWLAKTVRSLHSLLNFGSLYVLPRDYRGEQNVIYERDS